MPHGFDDRSMALYALPSSVGKFDSISVRYRRMSRILSRISMLTGQTSSQALHDVHAQISSGVMRSNTDDDEIVISGTTPMGGVTVGVPLAAITSPVFSTIS